MKHNFSWLLLLALAISVGACSTTPLSEAKWLILERKNTEYPEIVTVIRELPEPNIRQKFPVLIEFAWGYEALPNGMPSEDALTYARHLYTALDNIIGTDGIHVMTRSGDGGRTIYYYVRNAQSHSTQIRQFFDAEPPISIKVTTREDPAWDTVQNVLQTIK